jgi:hypothetical protein
MSSSESGYAKNAANLKDLILLLETLGKDYQPPKPKFELKELKQLSKNADEATRVVAQVLPVYRKAVDEQELIFKPLDNLVTRSFNYLKAAINNPAELQTAQTLARQVRGMTKKTQIDGETVSSHSRLSYDNKIENFKQYIEVLTTSGVYSPKETDISIKTFQTLLAAMESNITAVARTKAPLNDAQKKRFTVFYTEQIGLVDIVTGVKNYIKASLKKDHPQYKYILDLKFNK